MPKLPATAVDMPLTGTCAAISQDTESGGASPSVPTKQTMPVQGGGSEPASKYYPTTAEQDAIPDDHRTLAELPLTRPADDEVAPQPARRSAAEPRLNPLRLRV